MKKIEATRDEIIKMLKSGEIVFATVSELGFKIGHGIIWDECAVICNDKRRYSYRLGSNWKHATEWYVEEAKPFEFQVGDICEFGGVEGVIVMIRVGCSFPIHWVPNAGGPTCSFTVDGRYQTWHTKPLLNFIRRPKKKVKKTTEIVTWVEVDKEGLVVCTHSTAPYAINNRCQLLKSIATTEIEVDE